MSRTVLKLSALNGHFDGSIYPLRRSVFYQRSTLHQESYRPTPAMTTAFEIEEDSMSLASQFNEVQPDESNVVMFDKDPVEAARKKGRNHSRRREKAVDISRYIKRSMLENPWKELEEKRKTFLRSVDKNELELDTSSESDC